MGNGRSLLCEYLLQHDNLCILKEDLLSGNNLIHHHIRVEEVTKVIFTALAVKRHNFLEMMLNQKRVTQHDDEDGLHWLERDLSLLLEDMEDFPVH